MYGFLCKPLKIVCCSANTSTEWQGLLLHRQLRQRNMTEQAGLVYNEIVQANMTGLQSAVYCSTQCLQLLQYYRHQQTAMLAPQADVDTRSFCLQPLKDCTGEIHYALLAQPLRSSKLIAHCQKISLCCCSNQCLRCFAVQQTAT